MPCYEVFVKNDPENTNFTLEGDFLPREGDILWVRAGAGFKDTYKKQLKVIRIEHSVFCCDRENLFKPKLIDFDKGFDYPSVSYNVITIEVNGCEEAEKTEEKNMVGIIKPEIEEN